MMSTKIYFIIASFFVIILFSGCNLEPAAPPLKVGMEAPGFTLSDTHGKTWSLKELRGQVVFVNFWATWCPPCVQEMPAMQKLYSSLPSDKFKMLAIIYNDTPAMAMNLASKIKVDFPFLIDMKGFTALSYGLTGVPETYIVDKQGILREKFIGGEQWDTPASRQMLMKYINE